MSLKDSRELFERILQVKSPWYVVGTEICEETRQITIRIAHEVGEGRCPHCDKRVPGYDSHEREWRDLDIHRLKTVVVARVPRVKCSQHGVVTVPVPWAGPGIHFTHKFEAMVIDWLQEASILAVAKRLELSWRAVDGIMQRAVKRGLKRRGEVSPRQLNVDEVASRKGHRYLTVVSDGDKGRVLYVAENRKTESLSGFYDTLSAEQKAAIEAVAMDMWPAYIKATRMALPQADEKIAFDRFHVAKLLGKAVDEVRRSEHRQLMLQGIEAMKGSKYTWLRNPDPSARQKNREFRALRQVALQTARAWAMKETARQLWHYKSRAWAEKAWLKLLGWMARSRLKPMVNTSKTLRRHLWGILNAVLLKVTNAKAESINSQIKTVKIKARGFRNKQRLANAIYFHLGKLDLYPGGAAS